MFSKAVSGLCVWVSFCILFAGICPSFGMDYKKLRGLENRIYEIRGMKDDKGVGLTYAGKISVLSEIINECGDDTDAQLRLYNRFFYDVLMKGPKDQTQTDEAIKIIDIYKKLADGVGDQGKKIRGAFEASRMLSVMDRDGYLDGFEKIYAEAVKLKEAAPDLPVDILNSHIGRLWEWKMGPEALDMFARLVKDFPDNGKATWEIYQRAQYFLRDYRERAELVDILTAIEPCRDRIAGRIESEKDARRKQGMYSDWYSRYIGCLLKVNNSKDALVIATQLTDVAPDSSNAWILKAKAQKAVGNSKDAVADARKAVRIASSMKSAFEAQTLLVDFALADGYPDKAVAEGRILFDVAMDKNELGVAVQKIAKAIAVKDGHLANANAFVLFQKSGPTEEGAKAFSVARNVDPEFSAELLKAADSIELGVSPAAHRRKAMFQLYAGKPEIALQTMMAGYRILDTDSKSVELTIRCMAAAFRAIAGEALAAEPFLSYQEFGPSGPDGAPGNGDDLANPYPQVAPLGEEAVKIAEGKALEVLKNSPDSDATIDALLEYGSALSMATRFDEALSIARVAYNISNDQKSLDKTVMAVASAIRAQRGQVSYANQYIEFQKYGVVGKDKEVGTADDLQDVFVGAVFKLPESFVAGLQPEIANNEKAGEWRQTGYLKMICGDAEGALSAFKKERSHVDFTDKSVSRHVGDILAALKARDGNTFGGDNYVDFQRFGPAGRDGKVGTADDLVDPLAKY
ncbi:MAG: hypothetical protein JXR97_06995 [Planctomycetes bacterium]|nr:hypothetical protein [Planctomycetota bacterium]